MFLPAAGYCIYGDVYDLGDYGSYWSSTPYDSDIAYDLFFGSRLQDVYYDDRNFGYSVRAVLNESAE